MIIYNRDRSMRCDINDSKNFHSIRAMAGLVPMFFVILNCEVKGIHQKWDHEEIYSGLVDDINNHDELIRVIEYGSNAYPLVCFSKHH